MKVRVGVVGNGWWADSMYLPALANCEYGEVVAICGRLPDKTQAIAQKWKIPHFFSGDNSHLAMLEHVDAVIVASSTHTHAPITKDCLRRGKHVLCEKPLGTSARECGELVKLAEQKSLFNQVAFTYSYMPEMKFLVDFCSRNPVSRFMMDWNAGFMFGVDFAADKHNALLGNSILSDVGSHFVYLAQKMFGKIKTVYTLPTPAQIPSAAGFKSSELGGVMSLVFDSGVTGVINIQTDSKIQDPKFNMIQTISVTSPSFDIQVTNDWVSKPKILRTDRHRKVEDISTIAQEFTDVKLGEDALRNYRNIFRTSDTMARLFCKSIAQFKKFPQPDFRNGLEVQQVLDAALQSLARNQVISVNYELETPPMV